MYNVTPPTISSFVPLMYRMLVSELPTQAISDTEESKGASVTLPLAMSKMYHAVEDLCVVQLYVVAVNNEISFTQLAPSAIQERLDGRTPLGLGCPVLLRGAASMPSTSNAHAELSNALAANIDFVNPMFQANCSLKLAQS